MKIFKIEKQQSIQKVLEKNSKASRPVTELSKNPFLPCFSIIYFTIPQLKMLGLHKFSFSCRKLLEYLEYLKVASGPFPNPLISVLEYAHSPPFIKLLKTLLILITYKLVRSFPRPFHPFFLTGYLIFTQLSTCDPANCRFPSWVVAYV
jgi:hypothetical protein